MAWYVIVLRRANPLLGVLEGVGLGNLRYKNLPRGFALNHTFRHGDMIA
jgi:hypothetical protein